MRAGPTTTSREDPDGQGTRASVAANNDGTTRHNNKARYDRFEFLLGEISFCSLLVEELFGKYSRIKKKRNK
jgi:hypothetical protein